MDVGFSGLGEIEGELDPNLSDLSLIIVGRQVTIAVKCTQNWEYSIG